MKNFTFLCVVFLLQHVIVVDILRAITPARRLISNRSDLVTARCPAEMPPVLQAGKTSGEGPSTGW
jgi:hypothetical protein